MCAEALVSRKTKAEAQEALMRREPRPGETILIGLVTFAVIGLAILGAAVVLLVYIFAGAP